MFGKLSIPTNCGLNLSFICALLASISLSVGVTTVDVEWGSVAKLTCFPDEHNKRLNVTESSTIFWSKGEDLYVKQDNQIISYHNGATQETTILGDDGSLSLRDVDYNAETVYTCAISRTAEISFYTEETKLVVHEPPLRVLECNSTDTNQSNRCQVTVPNGTQSLTFTPFKAGLQVNESLYLVPAHNIRILTKTIHNITRNEDNSTTISTSYELDVSGLTSSSPSTLRFVLGGRPKEEFVVLLIKAEERRGGDGKANVTPAQTAWIVVGVLLVFGLALLVFFVIWRRKRRSQRGEPG